MTSKDVAKIATKKPGWWDDSEATPKGVLT